MPADPTGVTTDDLHGPGDNGGASLPPATRPDGSPSAGGPRPARSTDPSTVPDPPVLDPAGRDGAYGPGRGQAPSAPTAPPSPGPVPEPLVPVADPAAGLPPHRGADMPGPSHRRLRARHGRSGRPSRAERASRRGLRVDQRLWSIDPWSVFKVSVLFYICLGLIIVVAGTLLYNAGRSVGTIDQFESFVTRMGAYGECLPPAEVPEGTEFREDNDTCDEGEVLVGGFVLDDGLLFRVAAIGGAILVVAGSIGNVLLTVLVNLLNELTGGLRHTIVREPVARPGRGRGAGDGTGEDGGDGVPGAERDGRAGSPRPAGQR
jgi:hypothetical protein